MVGDASIAVGLDDSAGSTTVGSTIVVAVGKLVAVAVADAAIGDCSGMTGSMVGTSLGVMTTSSVNVIVPVGSASVGGTATVDATSSIGEEIVGAGIGTTGAAGSATSGSSVGTVLVGVSAVGISSFAVDMASTGLTLGMSVGKDGIAVTASVEGSIDCDGVLVTAKITGAGVVVSTGNVSASWPWSQELKRPIAPHMSTTATLTMTAIR